MSSLSMVWYGACSLAWSGLAGNLVIGLPKGSPLTAKLNAAMQALSDDGTLTSLRRAW